jgi:hypothetical protein
MILDIFKTFALALGSLLVICFFAALGFLSLLVLAALITGAILGGSMLLGIAAIIALFFFVLIPSLPLIFCLCACLGAFYLYKVITS